MQDHWKDKAAKKVETFIFDKLLLNCIYAASAKIRLESICKNRIRVMNIMLDYQELE